eukprot:CAMPEP_0197835630 /NCGR_PEP_ID=MMETSP1437-20131217/26432_1 /TAXON_ID=49252 ORGANISM="Eucampia antarctica, Strain CCMP1452" /NCGR_SAMPLE_ID=MMETSP1437 /ASSEMBLY_ACC=CAM_ASM_001096 /LENGTH=101 /DNA_ID=CAMNT_0043441217 /DNA_START=24 /DNA_END=332 /DNA_ORIENTATION=+
MAANGQRTSLQLYRDCLRLVRHIAPGNSPKGFALRSMVQTEFGKNRDEKDEAKLEFMKTAAIRGLSNYMLYESGTKDKKLGKAMNKFNDESKKDIDKKVEK